MALTLPPAKGYAERPPWTDNRDTVKVRLVDAAWNMMLTRDFSQISFRDLAKEVGVSTPAMYHHYATLEALGAELAIAAGAMLRQEMVEKTKRHRNARACFKAYLRFAAQRPHHLALMLAPQHRAAQHAQWARERFLADFEALAALDSGRKSATKAEAKTLWMLLHGAASLVAGGVATEREAFENIRPLLDTLTGRKGRKPRTAPKRARRARKS